MIGYVYDGCNDTFECHFLNVGIDRAISNQLC